MIDLNGLGLPQLAWGEVFHVGLRVSDIPQAEADLSQSMGLTFTPTVTIPMTAWVPGVGDQSFELHMSHSKEGPIHLELLQENTPGSVWDASLGAGLHHIGVWVTDVTAANEALVAEGWVVELAGESPEKGYGAFTYVRSPSGILFEPESCMGGGKERFANWWAGGNLF